MTILMSDLTGANKLMKKLAPKKDYVKFIKKGKDITPDKYLRDMELYLAKRMIVPKTKENHVGIEIEFIGDQEIYVDLMMSILDKGLEKNVVLGYDGSIEVDENDINSFDKVGYEIKIIDNEKNINKTLKKVMNILSWYNLEVNETCGLHIHLDARNKESFDMYNKLYNMKNILYKMVPFHRETNGYCEMPEERAYYVGTHNKGIEISKHNTIEVRLHHSTLDFNLITSWTKLLTKVVQTDMVKNNREWKRVPKFVGPELAKYVKSQMKMMGAM